MKLVAVTDACEDSIGIASIRLGFGFLVNADMDIL